MTGDCSEKNTAAVWCVPFSGAVGLFNKLQTQNFRIQAHAGVPRQNIDSRVRQEHVLVSPPLVLGLGWLEKVREGPTVLEHHLYGGLVVLLIRIVANNLGTQPVGPFQSLPDWGRSCSRDHRPSIGLGEEITPRKVKVFPTLTLIAFGRRCEQEKLIVKLAERKLFVTITT